ncbi:MAG: nucleoside monophosphate kinase [Candidatus Sungbacteria bacterium]|nr:nucleoside monophosphate kinase [Candidatus Sungbacteria bacterium]
MNPRPFILFIFGPPGSGKSTQAELVAGEFGATHFNTGEVLRRIFKDPANALDPKIVYESKAEERGELTDSNWVKDIVLEEIAKLRAENKSVIFSGSPRTIFEAEAELPKFKELYGELIFLCILQIHEETTMYRNSHRKVCSSCGKVFAWSSQSERMMICDVCGGGLVTRPDDAPQVIKKRLRVYRQLTLPILKFLESGGVRSFTIDGEPPPEIVFQSLKKELQKLI